MTTSAVVALNVLNLLTGGEPIRMPKHRSTTTAASAPRSTYSKVDAPKCPHGHFVRWARKNCKSCN